MMTAEEARAALTPQQVDGNLKILPFATEFFSFFTFDNLNILFFIHLDKLDRSTSKAVKRSPSSLSNSKIVTDVDTGTEDKF